MRLDEERISDDRAKSAQSGDKSELPEFFAKIEVEFDAAEMFLPVKSCKVAFDRQFEQAYDDEYRQYDQAARYNSFP